MFAAWIARDPWLALNESAEPAGAGSAEGREGGGQSLHPGVGRSVAMVRRILSWQPPARSSPRHSGEFSRRRAPRSKPHGATICQGTAKLIFRNAAIIWRGFPKSGAGLIAASRCPTIGGRVPDRGWKRLFEDPIELPNGGALVTLEDAVRGITRSFPSSSARRQNGRTRCMR